MDDSTPCNVIVTSDVELQLPVKPKKISVDSDSGVSSSTRTPDDRPKNLIGEDVVDCGTGFIVNSREAEVLRIYYSKLLLAMDSEIMTLSASLFSNNMISQETKYKVLDCSDTPSRNKCAIVLKDLESHILLEPEFLPDVLSFFDFEGSDVLKQISRDMRKTLDDLPPKPPAHSMSETTPRPIRRSCMCLRPFASSPAAFSPGLNPFCEQCEFQYRTLKTVFDKFWQESLKAATGNETEPIKEDDYCPDVVPNDQEIPHSNTLKNCVDSELQKAALPSENGSGPRSLELEASLFESVRSIDRQSSYDSVGGDDYISKLTSDFFEKLKKFHRDQKLSRKRIAREKKVINEKLKRTVNEVNELSDVSTKTEQELYKAKEEIDILKNALEDANSRHVVLAKEVLQYKRQLHTEKCIHGSSVECKHFVKCVTLEEENAALKKEVERTKGYNAQYKAEIESRDFQISLLLKKDFY